MKRLHHNVPQGRGTEPAAIWEERQSCFAKKERRNVRVHFIDPLGFEQRLQQRGAAFRDEGHE